MRIILIAVGFAIVLYLLWRVRTVVRLVAISAFLALALIPLTDAIERRTRLPRSLVILLLYLVLAVVVVLMGWFLVPSVVGEVERLSHEAPRYASELRRNSTFRRYDNRYHITAPVLRAARHLPESLEHLAGPLKDVTVAAAGFLGQLLTVLVLTFLLALHGREYAGAWLSLVSEPRRERYRRLLVDIDHAVAGYVAGNFLISALVTAFTAILLSLLGVPYALALAVVMGFFDLIPLVGATMGSIVVAIGTIPTNFPVATIIWIASIVLWQRLEDYLIGPAVYRQALQVSPIVTIVAVLVGASLLGLLGALIAIPIAAAIQIGFSHWRTWKDAGDGDLASASDRAPSRAARSTAPT